MFERDDWTLFRNLGTLGQKAGVPLRNLAALVVKELTDNALDAGASVSLRYESGWVFVEDDGPGIDGDAQAIARLFSIRRPLTSSKMIRLPSRGALGNGLRVVVGTVLASGGNMYIETRGVCYTLVPQDDGSTEVSCSPCARNQGTMVAVQFGPRLEYEEVDVLELGRLAIDFSKFGKSYRGKTSAWWYEPESFFEMCLAYGQKPLLELLPLFHGFTTDESKKVLNHLGLTQELACNLSRDEAKRLLVMMCNAQAAPAATALGKMGDVLDSCSYAHASGAIDLVGHGGSATVPFSIDAYVRILEDGEDDFFTMMVNRSPIAGEVNVQRQKSHQLGVIGCGLRHIVEVGRKPVQVICNVTTPYMPITTDGKEPDLYRYVNPMFEAITKAAKKAKRKSVSLSGKGVSQRDVIVENLRSAVSKASGEGQYRYSLRQLFYAVRPYMLEAFGKEPDYNYFAQVITDVEALAGEDLPGLYRDARGTIYHPHTGEEIALGTLNVEKYSRPAWTFNKILYSEKEGFFSILKDAGWPERNDCALLTSKGFASRAARDVLDLIGQTQEEIYFFCIHDADASGTLIYQALTEATRARGARKVHVINLGLDPWEAVAHGLQVETFRDGPGGKSGRRLPVADYVPDEWAHWLQSQRVELNAMSSPQFLSWLDDKFASHADKVVPPKDVLQEEFGRLARKSVEQMVAQQILKDSGFEAKVNQVLTKVHQESGEMDLEAVVRAGLNDRPENRWDSPIEATASELARRMVQ